MKSISRMLCENVPIELAQVDNRDTWPDLNMGSTMLKQTLKTKNRLFRLNFCTVQLDRNIRCRVKQPVVSHPLSLLALIERCVTCLEGFAPLN